MKIPRAVATRLTAAAVAVICATPATGNAQTWPDRAIHLIVPAGPGGPTDVLARLIADRLQQSLGEPVIVENRGGAGGAIGARAVAAAPPDGYTLMLGNTATLANIPAVSKNAGYDPVKNFAPIAKLTDSYQLLVVTPAFSAKSVAELIAYAKANPGKLDYAAVGAGNLTHLSGELLKARTGIDFAIVHYKSGAEAMTAVVGGQVQFAVDNVTVVRPLVLDRRLRALAVTSRTRQTDFPDLPTMIEAGIPDYEVTSFFGVVAPAATPMDIIDKLNRVINAVLRTPDMQTAFANLGARPATETPQQFAAFIAGELAKWTGLSNSAGIKVD